MITTLFLVYSIFVGPNAQQAHQNALHFAALDVAGAPPFIEAVRPTWSIVNQLVITLTGTVNFSNFDEWKNDLIAQIQSTNMELVTDEDFGDASDQVKALKLAEKTLKQAKQSAIDQAEEIQKLFSAIDEITEEARQARLSLERQIRELCRCCKDGRGCTEEGERVRVQPKHRGC